MIMTDVNISNCFDSGASKIAVFDFDGTIIRGDSFRIVFRLVTRNTLEFVYLYYIKQALNIIYYYAGISKEFLVESRRHDLRKRLLYIDDNDIISSLNNHLNRSVFEEFKKCKINNYRIIIVSAGLLPIISPWCRHNDVEVIAESWDTKRRINYNMKVVVLKKKLGLAISNIERAYGNSQADLDMLKLARFGFWVSKNGVIKNV